MPNSLASGGWAWGITACISMHPAASSVTVVATVILTVLRVQRFMISSLSWNDPCAGHDGKIGLEPYGPIEGTC